MVNGTEDRSLIQVNVIFNTDRKSPNSGNKATLPYGHFPERFGVKQLGNPTGCEAGHELPVQYMNSFSHVPKEASRTLDMRMVTPVGARTFIILHRAATVLSPHAAVAGSHSPHSVVGPGRAQRLVLRQMSALTIMLCRKRCQELSLFT